MLPLLGLVMLLGTAMIVGAEDLALSYRSMAAGRWWYRPWSASAWSYRLTGALFLAPAIIATIVALRQGLLFEGLLAGMVLMPVLVGIAALLSRAAQRLGAWVIVAFMAAVVVALISIAQR